VEAYRALDVSRTAQELSAKKAEQDILAERGQTLNRDVAALDEQVRQCAEQRAEGLAREAALVEDEQRQAGALGLAGAADLVAEPARQTAALDEVQQRLDALDALKAERDVLQAALQRAVEAEGQAAQARSVAEAQCAGAQAALDELARQLQLLQARCAEDEQALAAELAPFGHDLPEDGTAWLAAREAEASAWQQSRAQRQTLRERQGGLEQAAAAAQQVAEAWRQRWLACDRADLPEAPAAEDAQAALGEAEAGLVAAEQRRAEAQGRLHGLQERLLREQAEAEAATRDWRDALVASPFADEDGFLAACLDEAQRERLQALKERLHGALTEARALRQSAAEGLQRLRDEAKTAEPAPQLEARLAELSGALRSLTQRQGELRAQLQGDDARRQGQQALFGEIARQEENHEAWARLNGLIGSADGAKYRRFAQGLTLDHLVHLANRQLARLHDRYRLARKAGGDLELEVIDGWQADVARDTRTLSGGESFLVSLALALALSDLVSHKASIDSLFLDEGFGTLDGETLEIALDALDSLNASGKTVGIISHVEALKERIPVQLKVSKGHGMGYSRLEARFAVPS
jgi:exonuclease SbcC